MEIIRDLTDSLGVTPETFNNLIIIVIVVGGIWAVIRLYKDLTTPPLDETFPLDEMNEPKD